MERHFASQSIRGLQFSRKLLNVLAHKRMQQLTLAVSNVGMEATKYPVPMR